MVVRLQQRQEGSFVVATQRHTAGSPAVCSRACAAMAAPSALQAKLLLLACAWLGACASVQGAGEDLRSQPRPPRFADAYEVGAGV
jgi:predicted small secreted protein